LRATSVNTGGVIITPIDPKNVTAVIGSVVTLNLFAVIASTNSSHTDDGFLLTNGSYKSATGGLLGHPWGHRHNRDPDQQHARL
jgi:hypothetical protein